MPFLEHELPKEGTFKRWTKVSFDDIDYEDDKQIRAAQVSEVQRQLIRQHTLRVVRDALKMCYATQGVNHLEECKDLALKYLEMLPSHRIKGYNAVQRNDPSK
ncbi:hypothetical protein V1512DRAFT_260335 [Lipomyces arxii]|uniref:uncharacterized protein n=1 Tax=Lipomyces arxii TaxID=56418 RepID=UPI0034CD74B0